MGEKGDKTRRDIIDKTLKLFSVKGYFNTSINDILSATGLTRGGLYGHFGSKEAIWDAAYEEASKVWKSIVFRDLREIKDPLERVETFIEHDMRDYLGANVFPGGCFFLNMLVDLAGKSEGMTRQVWSGFDGMSRVLASWIEEADRLGMLKPGLKPAEVSHFIVISLNGAAALFKATKDPALWQETISQLKNYINQLRKQG